QPCGCPAAVISVANAGTSADHPTKAAAAPGEAVALNPTPTGGPSSTPADTAFPLAESEGLAPAPSPPTKPVALPGEIQSEVTTTLSYVAPKQTVPTGAPDGMATPESAATTATVPAPGFGPSVNSSSPIVAEAPQVEPVPKPPSQQKSGFFHKIGRLLKHIFG